MRSSRQDTEKHREEIIDAAAALVREKGMAGISVPDIMAAVGMTHGGFYRHFVSKDALAPIAYQRAFEQIMGQIEASAAGHAQDKPAALAEVVSTYLSPAHRDAPERGCATAALAGDMAREPSNSAGQAAYVTGVEVMVAHLEGLDESEGAHERALLRLSTMVGALMLARATRGSAISDELLQAGREGILAP
jgi:TetR/AcrR family transcriptional repressor of nem operon